MFEDESDVEDIDRLTINEHFAKAFQYKKEREELSKLKEKYGSDYDSNEDEEDSEDAESEDEDGEELTPQVDAAILRTLARIKNRDPEIYNSSKSIFEEEQTRTTKHPVVNKARKEKSKSKPINIQQATLASALNAASGSRTPSPEPLTHVEEQRALRDEMRSAFHDAIVADSGDDEDILVPREKTLDEMEREEEDYRAFLAREVGHELEQLVTVESGAVMSSTDGEDEEEAKAESGKKSKKKAKSTSEGSKGKGKSKQNQDQEFLLNYILNRGWIDRASRRVPTYGEIVGSQKSKSKTGETEHSSDDIDQAPEGDNVEELDDDFDEIAERFESSYNFRFEEPDAAEIKSFPRSIPMTVRREDTSRKEARERRRQRKEEELEKKREEIKRLKALKMREVRRKLERIGREGGLALQDGTDAALQDLDLDADWDPDAHDRQMDGIYGDGEKEEKEKDKKKGKGKEDDEPDGVDVDAMDAEVERDPDEEEWDGTEEMRKRKIQEYMDEVYGLDFNDMVAGMPTRFKYAPVASQTYSLTPAEILTATDAELNQFMSVKRYAPYRAEGWDHNRGARLKELRDKITERTGNSSVLNKEGRTDAGERPAKKRMGKKERQRLKGVGGTEEPENPDDVQGVVKVADQRKRKAEDEDKIEETAGNDVATQENDGPRKKKRRRHKKTVQQ
ncbi:hypothetical protein SERLA73DRAFT_159447 [Serpula lacrymans var. lacrymans S7.3]|uniref:Kri1-like C-terminal domain-containing protein n=1 Tax=Serpula lacrymans var. lacrymans (strain S7.3) TaxID=936435 RepID=F8PSK2_SERL3|nr:hypothetical protein SERLA73DRAFT_159447 [Serpula lacrymans var. lacrymans S7.3]